MVIVLFRSRLTAAAGADYAGMAAAMLERARTMAGFVDFTSYVGDDGEHLSVIRWESQDTLRVWAEDLRHLAAQRLGQEKWYESFQVEVAEVVRQYGFDRGAPQAS